MVRVLCVGKSSVIIITTRCYRQSHDGARSRFSESCKRLGFGSSGILRFYSNMHYAAIIK